MNIRSVKVTALTFLLAVTASITYAQRRERTVDAWRPIHYDVDLAFNDSLSEITKARTQIDVEVLGNNLTKIDFDFAELPIDSVTVAGSAASFDRSPGLLTVSLPHAANRGEKLSVAIAYHGRPQDGLVFANDRDGNPSATGDNWPNRVHYWIPSLDHPSAKATVSFTVSAPQRYQVMANGKFVTLTGNAATSNWKFEEAEPIPPYCMVIAINQGAIINSPDKSVTNLLYNVPKRDAQYAPKGFAPAGPALAFFSQTIAPYPYEKLALIIGATRFGGMENSSAIVFTSTLFDQRPTNFGAPTGRAIGISSRFGIPMRIESVVAHEIAHQWFGDSVTESTWADLWLSEGFATYFAGLFIQKYDGEDAFRAYMREAAQRYFNFEKQASFPIHDTETTDLMALLNPNNYEKGAWVLHMLRKRLGDDAFFRGLRIYYEAHKGRNATTEDLRAALEKTSGQDLREFFKRWIYGAGHPIYEVTWTTKDVTEKNNVTTVTIKQTQAGDVFYDPIPISFVLKSFGLNDSREVIKPTGRVTIREFSFPRPPDAVQIDPDDTLLKEATPRRL